MGSSAGNGPEGADFDNVQDSDVLPSLPDLLDSFDGDVCLSHLDELAQSLLREAAEEMDAENGQSSAQIEVRGCKGKSSPFEVVGATSENVEATRELINSDGDLPFTEETCNVSSESIPSTQDSSEYIIPKQKQNCETPSSEPVFGTYDESTHTITIVVPYEQDVCVEDAVQEVETSDTTTGLHPPTVCVTSCKEEPVENPLSPYSIRTVDSLSPAPSSPNFYEITDSAMKPEAPLSDCGYESLDSPQSEISGSGDLVDLWSESFSQLFPNLL